MKAIIHIGDIKTGTTSVQHFLNMNKDKITKQGYFVNNSALLNKRHSGLYAYSMDNKRIKNNVRKIWNIQTNKDLLKFRKKFEKLLELELSTLPDSSNVIFSYEMLLWLNKKEINYLKSLLNQFFTEFSIIVYIRRQDLSTLSSFGQMVKIGRSDIDYFYKSVDQFDYFTALKNWSDEFGFDNINVEVFESKRLYKNDLLKDFSKKCKLDITKLIVTEKVNKGLNEQAILFLIEYNKYLEVNNKISINRGKLIKILQNKYVGKSRFVTRNKAIDYYSKFKDINSDILTYFFPERQLLFNSNFDSYPEYESDLYKLNVEDSIQIFAHLWSARK